MYDKPKITIDFETRSEADLLKKGAWLYSKHPSTEVLVLSYKIADNTIKNWHPAFINLGIEESPKPVELLEAITSENFLIEAHNRFFEYCIYTNIMAPKFNWPKIKEDLWRCSAAKASYYNLPRSLDKATLAINSSVNKDMDGSRLMKKISKPSKKSNRKLTWHENREDFERLWQYCDMDVEAEHAFSSILPELPEKELKIWQMDQRMNLRGISCDIDMVKKAIDLKNKEIALMNYELADIMGLPEDEKSAFSATKRAYVKQWINSKEEILTDTQGATLDKMLAREDLALDVKASIKILREVNRTSTAKFDTMLSRADLSDNKLRDLMMYHGASTGRWAGKGVQPHNFPRGSIKDMDVACDILKTGDINTIRALYGEVMEFLSSSLRGALVPSEGYDLIVADYSAIEARVVLWLANQDDAMQIFKDESAGVGHGIYCDMASNIYGREITKKDKDERQFGKQAILGLGFEMGFITFFLTCKRYNISFSKSQIFDIVGAEYDYLEEKIESYFLEDKKRIERLKSNGFSPRAVMSELVLMNFVVQKYRARYSGVKELWKDQKNSAIAAIRNPGTKINSPRGRNSWEVISIANRPVLVTTLVSGKNLFYWEPEIKMVKTPFKNSDGSKRLEPSIIFSGVDPLTKKWSKLSTYGGKLVENITQATARDLLAEAMLRIDNHPDYNLLLSVHDEIISEVKEGKGDLKAFENLMAENPSWASTCPIDAEGWIGKRYRK